MWACFVRWCDRSLLHRCYVSLVHKSSCRPSHLCSRPSSPAFGQASSPAWPRFLHVSLSKVLHLALHAAGTKMFRPFVTKSLISPRQHVPATATSLQRHSNLKTLPSQENIHATARKRPCHSKQLHFPLQAINSATASKRLYQSNFTSLLQQTTSLLSARFCPSLCKETVSPWLPPPPWFYYIYTRHPSFCKPLKQIFFEII